MSSHAVKLYLMPDKKIYFFGGKGGVGKTTLSSAFSLLLSKKGGKTLLISTDPAHSLSDIFGTEPSDGIRLIRENLFILEIDPKTIIKEYIEKALRSVEPVVSPEVFEQIREVFHSVQETPGTEESAILEKLSQVIIRSYGEFDHFVIDTAPTGHTLQMLKTVGKVGKWLEELLKRKRMAERLREASGVMDREKGALSILEERRKRFSKFLEIILSEGTLFIPVLNPERLPIMETEKMVGELREMGIKIDYLIVNKVLPEEVGDEFLLMRKKQEREHMKDIKQRFRNFRVITLPMKASDVKGIKDLEELAIELGRRLGI